MAWLDFLSEPVGGYTNVQPEAMSPDAEFGQGGGFKTANSGVTWGQLLGLISSFSNTQGGQAFGGFMGQAYGRAGGGVPPQPGTTNTGAQPAMQPQIYQLGPTADFMRPEQKNNTSVSEIATVAKIMGYA